MTTPSKAAPFTFDDFVRVFARDPMFLPFRLRQAQARIKALEAQVAEQAGTIDDLLARLSEARRKAAEA